MKQTIRCPITLLLTWAFGVSALAQTTPDFATFQRLDKNGDGKITRDEAPNAESFAAADASNDGYVTPDEFRRYLARRQRPETNDPTPVAPSGDALPPSADGLPALKQLPDSDAVRDAAGTGQLFECVHVPGVTDIRAGMNGLAIVQVGDRDDAQQPVGAPARAVAFDTEAISEILPLAIHQQLSLGYHQRRERRCIIVDQEIEPAHFEVIVLLEH